MKYSFIIVLLLSLTRSADAQNIERKIIISNNNFYYTTIDEQFQIGTLHTGMISEALETAKQLALPAGRNYNEPVNPFSWDISGDNFYCINFLDHPLNDRNEALKRFSLSSLQKWSSDVTIKDMLIKSTDQNMFAYNEPYKFTNNRANVLNNFFFDAIAMNDSSFYMVIANNGELSTWNYDGKKWEHGNILQMPVDNYFTLFTHNKKLYMMLNSGSIYSVTKDAVSRIEKNINVSLASGLIIMNKEKNTVKFIRSNQIDQTIPFNKLLKTRAIKIF
ncbi:MAG: hypothetical protein ABIT08_11695 [Bacteroidia bacterium]